MSVIKKGWSRREFMRMTGTAGAAATVFSLTSPLQVSGASQNPAESPRVPTRPFGRSGIEVSILSLGGMFNILSNQLMLKQAVKWGVTYWDTADCYGGGNSEKGIGQFLLKYPVQRRRIFLVSKSDLRDPAGMTRLLDRSLERLQTSYIDLYLVHGIDDISEINDRTRAWAESAKADGKIRLFGFSTHSNMEECMLAASRLGWIDGIMMAYNFRLMHNDRMKRAVESCVQAGIGLTAMKAQGGGSVSTETEMELELAGRFLKKGFTDKQARLKAVWENPHIASICAQMPNLTILAANTAAALDRTRLASGDLRLLERYSRETASTYCAGCAKNCETAVGGAVPIRDVMRYLMYARSYGEVGYAQARYRRIPVRVRAHLKHLDFSAAERNCPQRMAIGRLMKEAAQELSTA